MADIYSLTIEADTTQVRKAKTDLGLLSEQSARASRENQRLTKASQDLAKASRFSSHGLRQTSMQLSQVAQQASATGNWVQALAIQLPDLALAFGPLGIAVGAVAGGLLTYVANSGNAEDSTETLAETIANLSGKLTEAKDGTLLLSEEMRELAKVSADAARIELIVNAQEAKKSAITAANNVIEAFESVAGENPLIPDTIYSDRLGAVSDQLKITREDAEALADALPRAADRSQESYQELLQVTAALAEKYGATSPEVLRLAEALQKSGVNAIQAIRTEEDLQEALDNTQKILERSADGKGEDTIYEDILSEGESATRQIKSMNDALEIQIQTIGKSEEAIQLATIAQLEKKGADSSQIQTAMRLTREYFDQKRALDALIESTKISAKTDPLLGMVSSGDRGQEIIDGLRQQATQVRLSLDEEYAIRQAHKERVIALEDALRLGVIEDAEERRRLEVESAKRRNEQLQRLEMEKYEFLNAGQQAFLGATANLFGTLAEIAEKGGKDQFDTWKTMASAQAAVSTALAVANALTAAPPPVNFALATAVGALGAVQIAQIQATEYQGARALGGSVSAGGRYLVGENGPEIVTMGGSGVVTPSSVVDSSAGGVPQITVNMIEDNSRAGTVERRQTEGGGTEINAFVSDIAGGGRRAKALEQVYGLRRQGR